jgi:hypothetical protein
LAEAVITSDEMQSMINATMPSGNCLTDMLSNVRMGLTPSYTASSSTDANANTMRTTLNCRQDSEDFVNISILVALPSHVITTLVKKYIERILPVYPFVGESGIWHHTKRAIEKMSEQTEISPGCFVRPDYDFLVLYLILAVSSTLGSASSKHEARCMGFSRSLFAEGIHHLSSKAPFPNDLAEIQSTLLILQYALINPKYANVWILGGVVMRSCLELGLHREVPEPLGLDPSTIDTRRKIFWAAYCMDRSICSALQRPLSIPDSTIDTWCPSSGVRVLLGPKQGPALRQIQYSKLQSTIIEVHFQGKELGVGQTWEDWLAEMEQNLRSWYEALPPDEDKISTELSFLQGLTDLNRPSPRMPFPSQHSLLVAFKAACGSAHLYQQHITTGFFRCPWLVAHNTFASAMVALFCLRYGGEKICERWSAAEIFQMTKMFTMNLLSLSGQGWAEISKYAGTYERLLGPLLDAVFSNTSSLDKTFNPEQDAELARLIYPGPAHLEKLRFGNRTPWDEDFQVFDPAMFNWDDDVPIDISWGDSLAFDNLDPSGSRSYFSQ